MSTPAEMKFSPEEFRALINQWPTFVAAKVSVTEIAPDWSHAVVRMELTAENANFFGTAFGGTLFSMTDPFLPILADRQLGPGYACWDKAAEIDFIRPGRSAVTARIEVGPETVEAMRIATASGQKHLRWFDIDLTDEAGEVVARLRRQLYVRRLLD
ncbi:DUF4442 domain-containing protein [Nocardioides alcanivorans]|uniref:DUF4442 domain-containing protein n=1 Tax=Nocardioides alcanivorans TaxID=2897352 RepID=UPI001F368D8A|nr:DUF4442 domain-containing protein [Nocardioides alcanivorans]